MSSGPAGATRVRFNRLRRSSDPELMQDGARQGITRIGADMGLGIQLLGQPSLVAESGSRYHLRSRKSWALLAYLILTEPPPTRGQLASLLFAEADDPIRALRWSLSELRGGI